MNPAMVTKILISLTIPSMLTKLLMTKLPLDPTSKLLIQMKKKNGNKPAKENMMLILKIKLGNWCLLPQSSPRMERNTLLCKACGDFELRLKMV